MLKIVHIITGLGQGGAETMLCNLLAHMDKTKFENNVISMMDEGVLGEKIKSLGIPLYCLRMRPGRMSPANLWHYSRLIKSIRPHIVQAWLYHANFFSMIARPFLPAHHIYFNVRTSLDGLNKEKKLTQIIVKLNAWLSCFATGVINNSNVSQEQHSSIGFSNKNAIYIGNGFDTNRFKPSTPIYSEFRKSRQYPAETKIIAMFARFHPVKNHDGFLQMAKSLKDSYQGKLIYLMAGRRVDDNNFVLKEQIQSLGLTDQVLLLGNIDVEHYLPAIDVVVLPSFAEGFPNIIGEAMACGVPCVATDVGDTRQLIAEYGYATPINNISALADYVKKILFLSPSAYQTLSNNCVEHIKQNHSIRAITEQYEKLYLQVTQ